MIERAKARIEREDCSVAAVTPDGDVYTDCGETVRPLFRLVNEHGEKLKGAAVADRIVGKAAAALICRAGASEVFGFLMSDSAAALLAAHGIQASCAERTPFIANRRGDDLCPMEKTVADTDDLEICYERIARFIAETPQP